MNKEIKVVDSEKGTLRLEAFSDGVFAIAITLLGLELKVPSLTDSKQNGGLVKLLFEQWPVYVSFLISFFIILVIWLSHHQLFKLIHSMNRRFFFSNALLLCVVTIIPFTTELVAEYFLTSYRNIAILAYTAFAFPVAFSFVAMLTVMIHSPSIRKKETEVGRLRKWRTRLWITTLLFLAASALVMVVPYVSLAIIFAAATYWSFGKTY